MAYVAKFDQATWTFFNDIGFTPTYLRESGRALAAVRYDVSYKKELRSGDVVTVRTRLLRVGQSSLTYLHEMTNGEQRADWPYATRGRSLRSD